METDVRIRALTATVSPAAAAVAADVVPLVGRSVVRRIHRHVRAGTNQRFQKEGEKEKRFSILECIKKQHFLCQRREATLGFSK